MKNNFYLLLMVITFIAAGCAPRYPVTKVNTIDSRPTLSFTNAPAGSIVVVDSLTMGEASKYNGKPSVLVVEPGTHEIAVMLNGNMVFQETVFVESENKIINVH